MRKTTASLRMSGGIVKSMADDPKKTEHFELAPSPRDRLALGKQQATVQDANRQSHERIYRAVMRGGGTAFGAPFALGPTSLTEKIIKAFRQRGFFSFETLEKRVFPS